MSEQDQPSEIPDAQFQKAKAEVYEKHSETLKRLADEADVPGIPTKAERRLMLLDFDRAGAGMSNIIAALEHVEGERDALRLELSRFKRGELTVGEFHNLCHAMDDKPGLTVEEFSRGCVRYQKELFGKCPLEEERDALRAQVGEMKGDEELAAAIKTLVNCWNDNERQRSNPHVRHDVLFDAQNAVAQSARQILFDNAPAIIAASSTAKRLREAEGLLREADEVLQRAYSACENQPEVYSMRRHIDAFLSPSTPAQTPRDERQG